jgi:CheY-like chemotaxis protein
MGGGKKRRMYSLEERDEFRDMDAPRSEQMPNAASARSSMSTMSRTSMRSMEHSSSDRSTVSQGGQSERRRGGGLKARITMFPQFEMKLEELKATATEMIEMEEDPEQQEVILTQYAEASLTILRQLRYHCMNSGLDGWRQGSMKRKVLIVDDSNVTRKLVSRAFEKANFIVDTATNGAEGVEKLKKSIYDIAFMDIDMPVMNGFEATKKLREWEDAVRPGTRQPICALTAAYVDDFERSELMKFKEAGLDVMESKPCNIPRLFKVVDDVSPMFSDLSISVIQQERGGM